MSKQTLGLVAIHKVKKVVGILIGKSKDSFAQAFKDLENYEADRTEVQTLTIAKSKANIAALYVAMPQLDIIISTFKISTKNHKSLDGKENCISEIFADAFLESVNCKIWDINRNANGYRNIQNFIMMIYLHLELL